MNLQLLLKSDQISESSCDKGMTVFDRVGNKLSLGSPLFEGGESRIYQNPTDSGLLIKLYKSTTPEKLTKVGALLKVSARADERLLRRTAWPRQAIFNEGGNCVGFIMRKISGEPIPSFYNPKERKEKYPEFTWLNLVQVAKNVAADFHFLHSINAIMGDVNERNFLVEHKTGMVSLINCDAYQITSDGRILRRQIGTGQWTPPELQGATFDPINRTVNHDLFGLALMIFQLLFMGRHPFACKAESDLNKAIQEHLFSYSAALNFRGITQPENTLQKQDVTPEVFAFFDLAFLGENPRPTAEQWFLTLTEMEKQLVECSNNSLHHHLAHQECPFCRLERAGVPVFNFKAPRVDQADTEVLAKIIQIPLPQLPPHFPLVRPKGCPVPEGISRVDRGMVITWVAIPCVIISSIAFLGLVGVLISVILSRIIIEIVKKVVKPSPFQELKTNRLIAHNQAQEKLDASLKDLNALALQRAEMIEKLKIEGDEYYKDLQELSLIESPTPLDLQDQMLSKINLKNVYAKALHLSQETAREIAQLEEVQIRNREVQIQAEADFQMVKGARWGSLFDERHLQPVIFLVLTVVGVVAVILFSGNHPKLSPPRRFPASTNNFQVLPYPVVTPTPGK